MNMLWGVLMSLVGAFFLVCASLKSNFVIYRVLSAKSKMLWGDNVHRFYQIIGAIIIILGILYALGVIWA